MKFPYCLAVVFTFLVVTLSACGGGGGGGGGSAPVTPAAVPAGANTSLRAPTASQTFSALSLTGASSDADPSEPLTASPIEQTTTRVTLRPRSATTPTDFELVIDSNNPQNGVRNYSKTFDTRASTVAIGTTAPYTTVRTMTLSNDPNRDVVLVMTEPFGGNNARPDLSLQAYGYWLDVANGTNPNQLSYAGMFSFGITTSPGTLPTFGSASYTGTLHGLAVADANTATPLSYLIDAIATAGVDFQTRSVRFATTGSQTFNGSAWTPDSRWNLTGNLNWVAGSDVFTGTVSGNYGAIVHSGPGSGRFYGPSSSSQGPRELGGVLNTADSAGGIGISAAFGATNAGSAFLPEGINQSLLPPANSQRFSSAGGANSTSGRSDLTAVSVNYGFNDPGVPPTISMAKSPADGNASFRLSPTSSDPGNNFNALISVNSPGSVSNYQYEHLFISNAPFGASYTRVSAGTEVSGAPVGSALTQVSRLGLASTDSTGKSHSLLLGDWASAPLNLSYSVFGRWAESSSTTAAGSADRLGVFAFGAPVSSAIPTSGTATYTGGFIGVYMQGSPSVGSFGKFEADGFVSLTADFAASTMSFSTSNTRLYVSQAPGTPASSSIFPSLNVTGATTISGSTFSGTGNAVGLIGNQALNGSVQGRFYGPMGAEVGGTFSVAGGSGANQEILIGGFGAKR